MYIRLTERCNMTCAHCCFSATTRGKLMDRHTFLMSLEAAREYGHYITLGGGEPTVHPEFLEYLELAIQKHRLGWFEAQPMFITNGKRTKTMLKLMEMIEEEEELGDPDRPLFRVELSLDNYHDPIDPRVERFFRNRERFKSRIAGTRTVSYVIPVGRAADRGVAGPQDSNWSSSYKPKCACDDVVIDPDGVAFSCGCRHTQIGHIHGSHDFLQFYNSDFAHEGGYELEEVA